MLHVQEESALRGEQAVIGTVQRVLVDEYEESKGMVSGRTEGNLHCEFPGDPSLIGSFIPVKIISAHNWALRGERATE